jgi:hypothetical protein
MLSLFPLVDRKRVITSAATFTSTVRFNLRTTVHCSGALSRFTLDRSCGDAVCVASLRDPNTV